MAFVSVEREPATQISELEQLEYHDCTNCNESIAASSKITKSSRSKSQSEDFFAYKGAAFGLKQSQCRRKFSCLEGTGELQEHLRKILSMIRSNDCLKLVVKLQSNYSTKDRHRYMVILCTEGIQDTEEYAILGIDIVGEKITIGLVLEIWIGMRIELNGDGGFKTCSKEGVHLFKPVSVQAMWAAIQSLDHSFLVAKNNNYHPKGLTHTWIGYYKRSVAQSTLLMMKEWNYQEDLEVEKSFMDSDSLESECIMKGHITDQLSRVMLTVDLENVTVLELRQKLEEHFGIDLSSYRKYIESETLRIYGQMDSPSKIFDHLYLGSIFNASNLEELERNNVTHILNVTREIDNFFLDRFKYKNVRLWDEEKSEILPYWEETHKFINSAKDQGTCVLVHCKMGVSRSASTVIAYAMKEYNWSLEEAMSAVKKKRSCIQPNPGFMTQLKTYEGILQASRQRHNEIFRHSSDLSTSTYRRSIESVRSNQRASEGDDTEIFSNCMNDSVHSTVNLDQEIFMFKPTGKQKESRSTSILSNISNRSQIVVERSNPSTNSAPASCHNDQANSENNANYNVVIRPGMVNISQRRNFRNRSNNQSSADNQDRENIEPVQVINSDLHFEEFSSKFDKSTMKAKDGRKLSSAHSDPCLASPSHHSVPVLSDEENQMSSPNDDQLHDYKNCPGNSCSLTRLKLRPDNSWIRNQSQYSFDQVDIPAQRQSDNVTCRMEYEEDVVFSMDMVDDKIDKFPSDKDTYSRENIPYNMGTVKQISGDLEFKIRRSRSQSETSGDNKSLPDQDLGATLTTNNFPTESSPPPLPECDHKCSPPQKEPPVSSIYEVEQICYEPGLVKRTKEVFAGHSSCQSLSSLNDTASTRQILKKSIISRDSDLNEAMPMSISPMSDGIIRNSGQYGSVADSNQQVSGWLLTESELLDNSNQSNDNNSCSGDVIMDIESGPPGKITIQTGTEICNPDESSPNIHLSDSSMLKEESFTDCSPADKSQYIHNETPIMIRTLRQNDVVQDSIRPVRELVGHFSWNSNFSITEHQALSARKTRTRSRRPFSSGEQVDFNSAIVVDEIVDSSQMYRHSASLHETPSQTSPEISADANNEEASKQAPSTSGVSNFGSSQFYFTM